MTMTLKVSSTRTGTTLHIQSRYDAAPMIEADLTDDQVAELIGVLANGGLMEISLPKTGAQQQPIDVECPYCGAQPGQDCQWGGTTDNQGLHHMTREAKASKGLFAHEAKHYE